MQEEENKEMGKNERIQQEANHLIDELSKGNENPGLGTKNLFKDVSYLRGRNGGQRNRSQRRVHRRI